MSKTFFIAGAQRSGTTLLSVLLSKHPSIDIDGNSVAFRLITCFGFLKDVLPYNLSHSTAELQSWLIENDYKNRLAELLDYKNIGQFSNATMAIENGIENRLKKRNKSVFGDKSPEIEYYTAELLMLLPQAKFIHVVRDGRAVAASQYLRANKNATLAAQEWMDSTVLGLQNQAVLGTEKYLIIKYEDLLRKPQEVLEKICAFLDLDFSPAMLKKDEGINDEKLYVKSSLDHSKIDSYKEKISVGKIKRIEAIQGPMLTRLGYNLIHPGKTGNHKQLSSVKRIFLSQMDNFKQLFIGKRTGMVDRKNVEVKISLSTRFKTYFFKLGHDLLPDKVFRRLFRKRWIKDVYYKNDPSK